MKKLYLLFAFLFALIGYQDAGAKLAFLRTTQSDASGGPCMHAYVGDTNNGWWGPRMEYLGDDTYNNKLYVKSVDDKYTNVIFNLGDNDKTGGLSLSDGYYYTFWGNNNGDNKGAAVVKLQFGTTTKTLSLSSGKYTASNVSLNGTQQLKVVITGDNCDVTVGASSSSTNSNTTTVNVAYGKSEKVTLDGTYSIAYEPEAKKVTFTESGTVTTKTISKVYLTNGSMQTELGKSGSNYVLSQNLTLTSGYAFKVDYSDATSATYGLSSSPANVNRAYALTEGNSTFALSSDIFASVTGLTVTVSGTALSTVSFAGTLKDTPASNVYLNGQWTNDTWTKVNMTRDADNTNIYTANITVTKKGDESQAWEFLLVDNGTNYKEPGDYWYTDAQLGENHVLSTSSSNNMKHKLTAGKYTFTWNQTTKTLTITKYVNLGNVNMPLKKADFAGGKKHYFLVGHRTAAWRLQPEWEFLPTNPDDPNCLTFELPADRLLYNGYVMVAMVSSYDDYIHQRYEAYSRHGVGSQQKFNPHNGDATFSDLKVVSGKLNGGKISAVRYDQKETTRIDKQLPSAEPQWYCIDILPAAENTGNIMSSSPSRAKVSLTINSDKTPGELKFSSVSTTPSEVAKLRSFSLVGANILNSSIKHEDGITTPVRRNSGAPQTDGWQESWIQYDSDAKPYIDANGDYMYQTVYQTDWLVNHPSYFNFGEDFPYTSAGITFTYDPEATHNRQFGNIANEKLVTYRNEAGKNDQQRNDFANQTGNNLNDTRYIETSDMACYVVKDMWMEGRFKVWSGMSGSSMESCYGDYSGLSGAQWYVDNGGHGAKNEGRAAYARFDKDMLYSMFENVGDADFAIGYAHGMTPVQLDNWDGKTDGKDCVRQYFNRIEIWYNTAADFRHNSTHSSIIRLVQEVGTPNIWIRPTPGSESKDQIDYNYDLPLVNGQSDEAEQTALGNVTSYKIVRVTIDGTNEINPVVVVPTTAINVARKDFHPADKAFVTDPAHLDNGTYRYIITITRANSGTKEYVGKSNRVYVPRSASANLAVDQTKDTDGRWNFDLKFTATAPAEYVGVKVRDDEGNETTQDALELMEWYEIRLPEGFSYLGEPVLGKTPATTIDGAAYKVEGNIIKVGRLSADEEYAMPDVTLENIRFGNLNERHFDFTSNVGSTQEYWIKNAQVSDGTDDIDLTVPATKLDIMAVNLIPEDNDPAHLNGHGDRHNVRKGHTREDNNTDLDNGVNTALSRANRIEANGVLDVLEVSDKVLENYDVKVGINLIYSGHEFVYTTPLLTPGVAINSMDYSGTGIGVDLSYLPLETREANIADLSIGNAKDLFKIEDETFTSKHGVTMERTYNAPSNTTVNYATNTYYQRKEDQENVVESQVRLGSSFSMIPAADMAGDTDAAGNAPQTFRLYMPAATGSFGPIGVQLHKTSWQGWYDAFAVIGITEPTGLSALESVPHYSIGIFTSNGETPATYDPSEPYHPIYPGGNVLDCSKSESNGYSSNFCVLNDRPSKRNFGEAALDDKVMKLPVLIGNVKNVGRDATLDKSVYQLADDPYGVLFTSYPIAFKHKDKDQLRPVVEIKGGKDGASLKMDVENRSISARDASTPVAMLIAEVPNVFKGTMGNATTDLEEVLGDFNTVFRAYPNPAVDIVNVEASAEIGDVEVIASSGAIALKDEIRDTKGQLDVSALPAGLYLLRTQAGTTRLIVK